MNNLTTDQLYSTVDMLGKGMLIYIPVGIVLTIVFAVLAILNFKKYKADSSNTKLRKKASIFIALIIIIWVIFTITYFVLYRLYLNSFLLEANGM